MKSQHPAKSSLQQGPDESNKKAILRLFLKPQFYQRINYHLTIRLPASIGGSRTVRKLHAHPLEIKAIEELIKITDTVAKPRMDTTNATFNKVIHPADFSSKNSTA